MSACLDQFGFDGTVAVNTNVSAQHPSSSIIVSSPTALQDAFGRLHELMQTSPTRCKTDASFLVGPREFFVHSAVILAWSRPLHVQLSTWKSESIVLNNLDPESFALMLKFMYTGKAQLCVRTAINLFYVSQRYEVFALMDICRNFVHQEVLQRNEKGYVPDGSEETSTASHFTVSWWPLYKLSADLGWFELKNACLGYAAKNLRQFVELGVPSMYVHAPQTSHPKAELGSDQGRQIEAKLLIKVLQLSQQEEIEMSGVVQLRAVAQWLTACAAWQQPNDKMVLEVFQVLPWQTIEGGEVQEMLSTFPILQHIPLVISHAQQEGEHTPEQPQKQPQKQPTKKRSRTYAGSIHLADAARTFPSEESLGTYARYKYEKHAAGTGYPDFMLPKRATAHSMRKKLRGDEGTREGVQIGQSKVLFDSAQACKSLPGFGALGKDESGGSGGSGGSSAAKSPKKSPSLLRKKSVKNMPSPKKVGGKRGRKSLGANADHARKAKEAGNSYE
jgi:hypothetical protein